MVYTEKDYLVLHLSGEGPVRWRTRQVEDPSGGGPVG